MRSVKKQFVTLMLCLAALCAFAVTANAASEDRLSPEKAVVYKSPFNAPADIPLKLNSKKLKEGQLESVKINNKKIAAVSITSWGGTLHVKPKKKGTAKITCVINDHGRKITKTISLIVKEAKNPFESFKIGTTAKNMKDYSAQINDDIASEYKNFLIDPDGMDEAPEIFVKIKPNAKKAKKLKTSIKVNPHWKVIVDKPLDSKDITTIKSTRTKWWNTFCMDSYFKLGKYQIGWFNSTIYFE